MFIELPSSLRWSKANSEAKKSLIKKFNLTQEFDLRLFSDLSQAVYEIAVGTAQFLPHKKSIAVISGNSWINEVVLPYFYKEGYNVQTRKSNDIQNIKTWFDSLNKDTVLLLFAENNPISGETIESKEIISGAAEKKIFVVSCVHGIQSDLLSQDVNPYHSRIFEVHRNQAFSLNGKRFKSPPLFVNKMNLGDSTLSLDFEQLESVLKYDKERIAAFVLSIENSLSEDKWSSLFTKVNKGESGRNPDRLILVGNNCNGELLSHKLAEKLCFAKLPQTLVSENMYSLSSCFSNDPSTNFDWWIDGLSVEQQRGSLILFWPLLDAISKRSDIDFVTVLGNVGKECQISFGSE